MEKPREFDSININRGDMLTAGGHKCVIRKAEERMSSTGKQMLVVSYDTTAEDTQPGHFRERYLAEKKAKPDQDIKWRGNHYFVDSEYFAANLKRFTTALEESNPGWQPQWGEQFCNSLIGKKVGVVFREEEYTKDDHTVGVTVKSFRFCDYDKALEQPAPKRKEAPAPKPDLYTQYTQPTFDQQLQMTQNDGFMSLSPDELKDEGLPFA